MHYIQFRLGLRTDLAGELTAPLQTRWLVGSGLAASSIFPKLHSRLGPSGFESGLSRTTHLSASDSLRPWRYINLLTYLLTFGKVSAPVTVPVDCAVTSAGMDGTRNPHPGCCQTV